MGWARIKLEADQRAREDQRCANDWPLLPTNFQRHDLNPGRAIWFKILERVLREGRTEVLLARQPRPAVMINGEKLLAKLTAGRYRYSHYLLHLTYVSCIFLLSDAYGVPLRCVASALATAYGTWNSDLATVIPLRWKASLILFIFIWRLGQVCVHEYVG